MNKIFLLLILVYSCNVLSKNCITFHTEEYCKAWNNKADDIKIIEYIRASESVNSWNKMITMKEYSHKKELNKILPAYIESIKSTLATKPEILQLDGANNDKSSVYFVMFLLAPDMSHYEYVINRFYTANGSIWSVFYSEKIPFSKTVTIENYATRKEAWINELSLMDIEVDMGKDPIL